MKKKAQSAAEKKDEQFPLPVYNDKDDIYKKAKEEPLGEDERTGKISTEQKKDTLNMDLDVPGADADDNDELIGEEDEENNYYSLGGENHEGLEEDDQ
ncbi:MAG: hypothetical protein QM764_23985 [Chitinophagaceae bacterium]